MKYNSIIIGGGLAGLTCAIRCAESGLKTALISSGESSLTFASGSIDVLGQHQDKTLVQHPFEEMACLPDSHPYQKLGAARVKQSLGFFKEQMSAAGIDMVSLEQQNHFRVTALGSLRPAWLSQASTRCMPLAAPAAGLRRVAVVNIAGFRDFQPALVAAGMKKHPAFASVEFTLSEIDAATLQINARNVYELRSLDLARTLKRDLLDTDRGMNVLASALQKVAGSADLVVIPAVLGADNGNVLIQALEQKTGLRINEVATLPPSLPGMRLATALKQRFSQLGGMLVQGDQVTGGTFDNGRLLSVQTRMNPEMPLSADHFVLASGSFFSQGLASNLKVMKEATFNLNITATGERQDWSSEQFIKGQQHGFTSFGVLTDSNLRPYMDSTVVENLYCAGAVMGGFNSVAEGSAGGVAISTGWHVAEQIISAQAKG